MKTNKTYATLAGAYASAERAGAERFDLTYNGGIVLDIIARTYKHTIKRTLAKWNLVRIDKTLYALESTTTPDCRTTFKWNAIATFDSDGIPYAVHTEAPKTEDKTKTQPRKPAQGKGEGKVTKTPLQLELDTLAGTGDNSKAHKVMCKHGLKNSNSEEYKAVWQGYWWTIR